MAENISYKLSIPAADVDKAVIAGLSAYSTPGILYGDGQGGIRTARPGEDYGYPLIQGNGPPGGSTVANLGQHYFDMAASKPPYEYICVGYTAFGFVWTVYGDPGAGFRVLGRFSSLEALEAAVAAGFVPQPSPGDAYFIGDVAPYNMYFWDIMIQNWAYYGPLGGAGGGSGDVTGIPPHGDTGQVLKKRSDVDYDVSWGEAVPDGSVGTAKLANGSVTGGKLAEGSVTADKLGNSSVPWPKLANDAKPVAREDVVLSGTNWQASDTHAAAGFPYRAAIAISGVTSRHLPIVTFSPEDAYSGKYAPVAESYDGGVYIYASEALASGTTIPSIVCIPT